MRKKKKKRNAVVENMILYGNTDHKKVPLRNLASLPLSVHIHSIFNILFTYHSF